MIGPSTSDNISGIHRGRQPTTIEGPKHLKKETSQTFYVKVRILFLNM